MSFLQSYGNTISSLALLSILVVPTVFSMKSFQFTKRLPNLIELSGKEIIGIDTGVITGTLVFLSLSGFQQSFAQITFLTANIVFPFAISIIVALTGYTKFSVPLIVAGFINLMIAIVLIAFLKS